MDEKIGKLGSRTSTTRKAWYSPPLRSESSVIRERMFCLSLSVYICDELVRMSKAVRDFGVIVFEGIPWRPFFRASVSSLISSALLVSLVPLTRVTVVFFSFLWDGVPFATGLDSA